MLFGQRELIIMFFFEILHSHVVQFIRIKNYPVCLTRTFLCYSFHSYTLILRNVNMLLRQLAVYGNFKNSDLGLNE